MTSIRIGTYLCDGNSNYNSERSIRLKMVCDGKSNYNSVGEVSD